jgi:hypothetical protein
LSPAEANYEIYDKKLLAIVQVFEEWRAELVGLRVQEQIEVVIDHRALEYFMTKRHLNARQARWAEFLAQFDFIIRYLPGKLNILVDALSRQEKLVNVQEVDRRLART